MNEQSSSELKEPRFIRKPEKRTTEFGSHFFWEGLAKSYLDEIREEIEKHV